MEVRLSDEQYFKNNSLNFDQREALKVAGLKAAVCFKQGEIAPWDVRKEDEETLIRRGIDTILSDHVTPSQQVPVSLEIYGIPKIICMYLNNLGMQAADERSLRYTEIKDNNYIKDYITLEEIKIYQKWMEILQNILWKDYNEFFLKTNNNDEKKAKTAIKKIAQENSRSFVSIKMPTSLTFTSNFAEFNKLALQIERTIKAKNNTELEELAIPYLKELLEHLKRLNVIITNENVWEIAPKVAEARNIPKNDDYLYKDTKGIDLNLFATKNPFSGMHMNDEYGVNIHTTKQISFSGFAQLQRHRTLDTEIYVPSYFDFFIPEFIKQYPDLVTEWMNDADRICKNYPQGQIIDVSIDTTLKKLISYVGTERGCNHAQYEIAKFYMELIKECANSYIINQKIQLTDMIRPYVGKYRCLTKTYKCPSPCNGGPRMDRKF